MDEVALRLIGLLQQAFDGLANQLGIAAPKVWEILIRQQYVEAAQSIGAVCLIILVPLVCYKTIFAPNNLREWDDVKGEYRSNQCMTSLPWEFVIPLIVIGLLVSLFSLNDVLGKLINPEYYALKSILKMIPLGK